LGDVLGEGWGVEEDYLVCWVDEIGEIGGY